MLTIGVVLSLLGVGNNPLVRAARRLLPVSDAYAEGRLIARVGGRRVVTPLFLVFVAIGGTDILFALDSIPAVFGVTDQARGTGRMVNVTASTQPACSHSRSCPRACAASSPRAL